MTGTRLRFRRHRSQFQPLLCGLRYRLIVPVFRSCRSPVFTARGVANGVFWGLTQSHSGNWVDRVTRLAGSIGGPTLLGSVPYAVAGAIVSYRWALKVGRRRKARLTRGGAAHLPAAPSGI